MARAFFRRHWRRALLIRERLRLSEDAFHLLLAGGVGVIGGLTRHVFHACNQFIQLILLGETGDLLQLAENLAPWQRLLIPTLGGFVAGSTLYWGLRLLGNPGLSNLLEVVVAGDGRLSFRSAFINALSSLTSISTGASIGREGLIVQLTASLASKGGQWAQWPPYRLRLLVACGASAGLAAACNAPIAGAVFAAQVVLGNFSMNLFAPLVVSSVVAAVIARGYASVGQWFTVPPFDFTRLSQLPWFVVLGFLSGLLGALFLKLLSISETAFNKIPVPLYGRLALAGLGVGIIAAVFPEVLGNGYGATDRLLHGHFAIDFLAGVFLAKLVATAITVGAGTVGGVFTPTLLLGAALGSFFGGLLNAINLGGALPNGAFALVGMGSLLAATTHSPLVAMIMIFELSVNYSIMPPLMIACVVSTLVARRLHPESIYTEPLRRKGLELERESAKIGAAAEKTVGDVMREPVPPLRETATFREIADRFLVSPNNFLPVVDGERQLIGVVALQDMKEYLHTGHELNGVIAFDVMRNPPPCLTPNQKISDALAILLASELRNVPVVNSLKQFRLVGSVSRAEALGLVAQAISASKS
ncbi:MAG: voltage-gated chloride channel ClcB [Verrucomicrobia bacterium]|nr:MAG: voltage-gated chloride channel ClcB [Verrucomicrobiota bacterium]